MDGDNNGLIIGDSILPDIFTVKYCQDLGRDAIILYLWLNMSFSGNGFDPADVKALRIVPDGDVEKLVSELVSHGLLNRRDGKIFLEDIKAVEVEDYVKNIKARGTDRDGLEMSSDEEQRNTLAASISKTFYSGKMNYTFYRLIDKCLYEYKFDGRVCYRLFEEGYKNRCQFSYFQMEKLASEWYNKGYVTIDKLDEYLGMTVQIDKITKLAGKQLRKHLYGMDIERIERWVRDYKVSAELVNYAFKVNEYRDKINLIIIEDTIKKWFDAGVDSLEKAERFEEEEHKENSRKRRITKKRSNSSWKTGSEAGIDAAPAEDKELDRKNEEKTAPEDDNVIPSDVLGMFGGEDEDD